MSDPMDPYRTGGMLRVRTGTSGERAAALNEPPVLRGVLRYALPVGAVALALAGSLLLGDVLESVRFMLFWPAVLVTAVLAGLGPAVLASVLSVTVVHLVLTAPRWSFAVGRANDLIPLAIFLLASLLVSTVADRRRKAESRLRLAARDNAALVDQLESQAVELEVQLEESNTLSEELAQSMAVAEAGEAYLGGILESISEPFVVQDAEWRFRFVNSAAARALEDSAHIARADIIGKVVWDLYPGLVGTPTQAEMKRAARERVTVEFELFAADQGTWSELRCYPLPDGGLATLWKDVTVRKKAEEAVHYLDRASDLLATPLDAATRLQKLADLVVPELADWCGIDLVGDKGQLAQAAVAHVDPAKIAWARELNRRYPPRTDAPTGAPAVVRTGVPELYSEISDEMIVASAEDEDHLRLSRELDLRSAMVVPLVARGQTFGALTLVSAESRRRYTSEDLALAGELARRAAIAIDNARQFDAARSAQLEAETANRAKAEFLAAMSHELRTPLNAIAGYTELIAIGLRGPVTDAQRSDLERVQRAQRHLQGLITSVLNFARVEAGHVEYEVRAIPVASLLEELQGFMEPQLHSGKLTFHCHVMDDSSVAVSADRDKARQILLNLLSNSVKFTPVGGHIDVSCEVRVHEVLIRVADTGIGIPADRRDAVFEPFVQVHRSLIEPTGGVGLGLAISRDLARGMGGDLTVQSAEGKGSTFTLCLPLADAPTE
ncbi:MAG: ATP-binding protein [bacterium]